MTRWLVGCALCAGILVGCSDSDSGEAGGEGGASGQCSGQVSGSCVYTVNCIEYYGVDYAEIESRCTIGTPSKRRAA